MKMATMFLCFSVLRSISLAYALFFIFWAIRCSVGATYTLAFSFAVLCQLFSFSVICYFRYAVLYFYDGVGYVIFLLLRSDYAVVIFYDALRT